MVDKQRKLPELLAPAGDMERLKMAVLYGADAVYLAGTDFGMRAFAGNFDPDELKAAVAYAHAHNVRVHCTINTMPRGDEIVRLPAHLERLNDAGVDAVIVADLGAFTLAGKYAPNCQRHISTQASISNYVTANAWYDLGASRVILARELSLEEIRTIRENTPAELEIETFVHGAMCVSYSGRCLLSNYMTGRDASRGACAQPCRYHYALMEEKRPGEYFPIEEDEKGSYILNSRDMCMIDHLDDLLDVGLSSLKIEGRAKSAYYVSVVTNAYRQAVDQYVADPENYHLAGWLAEEVYKVSHREYCTGFYYGRPDQCYLSGGYVRECDIVAVVDHCADGWLYGTQRNRFAVGDEVEILEPGQPPYKLTVAEIRNGEGESVPAAPHAMMAFSMPCPEGSFTQGTIIRKNKN